MPSSYPSSLDSFPSNHADNVGEKISAATINNLADAVNHIEAELGVAPRGSYTDVASRLNATIAARVYSTVALPVSGMNVDTALTYNTVRYDTNTFWSNVHPTRLTAPKTGTYHIGANVVIDNPSSATARCYLKLLLNGTTDISQKAMVLPIGTDTFIHRPVDVIATDWLMNAGDYVEVIVSPDYNIATINVQASPAQSPEFWMHFVGQ